MSSLLTPIPVSEDDLAEQGLGQRFIRYMQTFQGFVEAQPTDA